MYLVLLLPYEDTQLNMTLLSDVRWYCNFNESNAIKFIYIYVGFHSCVDEWCFQKGTNQQYTRCKTVSKDGRTCYNPTIKYGSTTGGSPGKHPFNNIAAWCQQLFPNSIYGGTVTYIYQGRKSYGTLLWCSRFDEINPHWCDCLDGYWKDSTIDGTVLNCGQGNANGMLMNSVTCQIP